MSAVAACPAQAMPATVRVAAPALPRVYRSARQRERGERILEVTRSMLTEAGYHGVTMRDVCERAGVARKTLYDRFGSKDALVLAAVTEVLDAVDLRARKLAGADDGIGAVLAYQRAAFRQIVRAPKYAAAMGHALFQAAPEDALSHVLLRNRIARNASALAHARARGELAPAVDIDTLAAHLTAQSWGVIMLWMKGLVALDRIETESRRACLMTLVAAATGARREALIQLLGELH
jgi:AcrR family transcriptional regulator